MANALYPVIYVHTGDDEVIMDNWQLAFPENFWERIRRVHYADMFGNDELLIGHTIFADLERLDPKSRTEATRFWHLLKSCGHPIELLNHPNRAAMRYELLRKLYETGHNAFNVYRLAEGRLPARYPVFVRAENDHLGARSDLLKDAAELATCIDETLDRGVARDSVLIEEFIDTVSDDGVYRKYSAFKIGKEIIPAHIFFSKDWNVKKGDIADESTIREEREFIENNNFSDQVRDIFAIAEIDYGRIDFGIKDGRVQTWEINTHPVIVGNSTLTEQRLDIAHRFMARFAAAFLDLGAEGAAPTEVEVSG
ncbi:MAG: hypothetical protein GY791_02010 [Alphaproteobacteria bacterium]|nr:hypothetical protein [Alphaproteobacteria bacterium]